MSKFRLFLHAFGIHYWIKWSEPETLTVEHSNLFGKDATIYVASVQKRECKICNLKQLHEISN